MMAGLMPRETRVNAQVIRAGKQMSTHNVDKGATKGRLSAYFHDGMSWNWQYASAPPWFRQRL